MKKEEVKVKKLIRLLFMLTILMSILTACAKQNQSSKVDFMEPDIIMIYKYNSTQTIEKDNKLYPVIVSEMKKRFSKNVHILRLTLDENEMKNTKQSDIVIEFLYYTDQKSMFDSLEKEYSSLIFPLKGENKQLCFFEESKNYYDNPIGSLKNSNALLELFD